MDYLLVKITTRVLETAERSVLRNLVEMEDLLDILRLITFNRNGGRKWLCGPTYCEKSQATSLGQLVRSFFGSGWPALASESPFFRRVTFVITQWRVT